MTFQSDLAWEGLNSKYRSSAAYQLARYALRLTYDVLPEKVAHQAKRCLLDALACNIGGFDAPGRPICEDLVMEIGGKDEATVVGSGLKTSALNATLVNSFMTRFTEANDSGGGGHNNESIPSILAVAERQKSSGREVLASIVCSYELGARVKEAVGASGKILQERGFNSDSRGCLSLPPTLGRLMGLNEEQLANAIGCLCGNVILNAVDADEEENTMRKNLRLGWVAHAAITYCMLAKKGFTGPLRIVESEGGWDEVMAGGALDYERLVDFSGWRIMDVKNKVFWAGGMLHGHLMATRSLVKEHNLKPTDIEAVHIKVGRHAGAHNTPLAKKYPRNSESADHSSQFLTAMMIIEHAAGHNSIDPKKFTDPLVLDLIERVTVAVDPELPEWGRGGVSEITTKDGRVLKAYTKNPHGYDPDSLLSDEELEDKFREFAGVHMKKDRIEKLIETVWNVDKLDNIDSLMKLTVF